MLQSDGTAHQTIGNSNRISLLDRKLRMRGRSGMRDNCSGIAEICGQGTHFYFVQKISAGFDAAFYFERDDISAHFHLLFGSFVIGM